MALEDDIGEIKDELAEYKKQLDTLREDLRLLIENETTAKNSILSISIQSPNQRWSKEYIDRCKAFVQKYGVQGGF